MQFPRISLPATATRLLAAAVLLAAAACGDPSGPRAGPLAQLAVVSGDDQKAPAGQELPQPLVARVTDARGRPVEGQLVNFRVVSGGGSVYAGSSVTNREGMAQERWTLGTVAADSQRVEARAVDAATGQALVFATFRAVAQAGAASTITPVAAQVNGLAGLPVADSVAAVVRDAYGNAVSGAQVAWTVTGGGGSVSPATSATDAQGIARAQWTLGGSLSAQTLQAAAGVNLTTTITANAGLGGTAAVTRVSGDAQTGVVGTQLAQPLVVEVRQNGVPIAGAQVVWAPAPGMGSASPATSITDAQGRASTTWTLGTGMGTQTLAAQVQGGAGGVLFSAQATSGTPATLEKLAPAAAGGLAGFALDSVGVRVVDAYGNPVPGVAVAWTVRAGGGSVSPAAATTNAQGIARAAWTLGAAGPQQLEAAAPGMPPVAFASTSIPVPILIISGTDQAARVGLTLPQPLVVKIVTPDGQPLAGIPVRWATADGGTVSPAESVTDAQGMASTTWTLGTRATNSVEGSQRQAVEVTAGATTARAFFASARPGPLAAVVVEGSSPIPFGDVRTARGVDALGNTVGVDDFGHTLTTGAVAWTSSAPAIVSGTAEQHGRILVRGTGVGSAQITGTFGGSTAAASVQVSALPQFASLSGGAQNACGMSAAGTVYCWGYAGALGQPQTRFPLCVNNDIRCSTTAVVVPGTPAFVQLEAGGSYVCGLTAAGAVYCWDRDTPAPTRLDGGVALDSISVGGSYTYGCGLDAAGKAWCWGVDFRGKLGNGQGGSSPTPVAVAGGLTFRSISTGSDHACGITTAGAAYCWGWDAYGQLGSGAPRSDTCLSFRAENPRLAYCSHVPVPVAGGHTFTAISAGGHGTCALDAAGAVYCWGIVDPFTAPNESDTPHAMWSGFTLESISGDQGAGCGLAAGGAAYCWGTNVNGDLGNGTTGGGSATPVAVSGGLRFKQLSGARTHCGLTTDGSLYCWGTNDLGQLGNGTRTHSSVPVRIRGQQ